MADNISFATDIYQCGVCGIKGNMLFLQEHILTHHTFEKNKENLANNSDLGLASNIAEEASSQPQPERGESEFWSENETLALLTSYENHLDDFRHAKKRKSVWKIISEELISLGIMRLPEKCERKWLNMVRVYRTKKDGQMKTGRGSSVAYKYYERMDEILGDRPSNTLSNSNVLDVGLSTETLERAAEEEVRDSIRKSPERETEDGTPSKKIKLKGNSPSNKIEYLRMKLKSKQEEREKRDQRHREIMAVEKEKLELERQKIETLEKLLKSQQNN